MSGGKPGFWLYRGNRLELLLDSLAAGLAGGGATDPLQPECVVVQSRGMATWLSLRLAERFGVWANSDFPHPRALVQRLLAAALGPAAWPATSRELLTLAILQELAALPTTPDFTPLERYLAGADDWKRLQLAEKIADLFDQYTVFRPEMLLAWEKEAESREELADNAWQPLLWRRLVGRLGSPVAPLPAAHERLAAAAPAEPALLPGRLFLFGVTTLPPLYLSLLNAAAASIPVHLLQFSPAREYWADLLTPAAGRRLQLARTKSSSPDQAAAAAAPELHLAEGHPLLASLGIVAREFQDMLEETVDYQEAEDGERFGLAANPAAPTLLARLQDDITRLRPPTPAPWPAQLDDSLQIHICHSPLREVEVLQDQLLNFIDRGGYRPHEIVVMVPDIETYAPLIEAVFNRPPGDRRRIPYRIADRRLSRQAELIDTLFRLFELARGRLEVSAVLDLLAAEPLRRAWNLDDERLRRIEQWLRQCRVCWGIDADHRHRHGQPEEYLNSWRFGLDRLLLGYALGGGEEKIIFAGILPHDDIEGQEAATAGILLACCQALFELAQQVRRPQTLADWAELTRRTMQIFFGREGFETGQDWQRQSLGDALAALVADGRQAALEQPLELPAFLRLLRSRLDDSGGAAGFLEGGLTFCNMLPMRTIPFPVVCLLGMNNGDFPRTRPAAGFDLLAAAPRPGDRCRRRDDRFLFLEALLAARDKFYLSYVGRSSRDNRELPPSVLVDELLDCLALMLADPVTVQQHRTFGRSSRLKYTGYEAPGCLPESAALLNGYVPLNRQVGAPGERLADEWQHRRQVAARLQTEHPLQPFSPRYFKSPEGPLFSYASEYLVPGPAADLEPAVTSRSLPATGREESAVSLADLHGFFRHPARWYGRRQLGLRLPEPEATGSDREPLELVGLDRHRLGELLLAEPQRLLSAASDAKAAAEGWEESYRLLRAAGELPPGKGARLALTELVARLQAVAGFLATDPGGAPLPPLVLDLALPDGSRLGGELVQRSTLALLRRTPSSAGPSFWLRGWLDHLALCAGQPADQDCQTIMVGLGPHNLADVRIFRPLPPAAAAARLAELLMLYRAGQQGPLPFFRRAGYEFVVKLQGSDRETEEVRREKAGQAAITALYGDGYNRGGPPELADPYAAALFGLNPELEAADRRLPPGFTETAILIYQPMLSHLEKVS